MPVLAKKAPKKTKPKVEYEEPDYSLNDVMLRGRVSDVAIEKFFQVGIKLLNFV
jgi:hypothetical protein